MKEMMIERFIEINDRIKQVLPFGYQEKLYYFDEKLGKRCKGSIIVDGNYENDKGEVNVNEEVFLDILAPKEKLGRKPFVIHVDRIDANMDENGIKLNINLLVDGMKEDDEDEIVESINDEDEDKELDNLFEEDPMVHLCTMVVVHENDTYASISYRYQVDESKLRAYNQNKAISPKMLLMLPPSDKQ